MHTDLYKTGRFTRDERVNRSEDIRQLFKKGKRFSCDGAKLFVLDNDRSINRIGFTLPRGYGKAVERNRSKRISREVYRLTKGCIKSGYDMVLLVYPGKDEFSLRNRQLMSLFTKAGLLI
jgi:ribonuclease P protein component